MLCSALPLPPGILSTLRAWPWESLIGSARAVRAFRHFCLSCGFSSAVMVILNTNHPGGSSTTGDSDSSSEDDRMRSYNQPSGARQMSSSSSSESDSEGPPVDSVSEPKRAVGEPSPSMEVKRDGKRNRGEAASQEEAPAKRKGAPKKTDSGEKPSPPRRHETLPKGSAEKTLVKSGKEKKSPASKDENHRGRQQIVREYAAPTPVKKSQRVLSDKDEGGRTVSAQQNGKVNCNGKAFADDKMAWITELRTGCMKMIEVAEAMVIAFVEKLFKSAIENLHRGDGGIRGSPAFSSINRELMDEIFGAGGFPLLDGAQAEKLEQKWREQHIVEMEAFSRRLHLLQEECQMYSEWLKSPTGSGSS